MLFVSLQLCKFAGLLKVVSVRCILIGLLLTGAKEVHGGGCSHVEGDVRLFN